MKKTIATLMLSLIILGIPGVSALADAGSTVYLSFNSYGGDGFVDGGNNGQYYSLTSGAVHLNTTYTNANSYNNFDIELRR